MQLTYLSHQIHSSNGTKSGLHTKSDLIPAQQFTFIGIEFLTIENSQSSSKPIRSSYSDKSILSQTQVLARTFLSLLGKLSAAADLIVLGRLHLRRLQMCLLLVWKPHILPFRLPG